MTGRVADWNRQSMKKDGSKPTHGVRDMGSLFHSKAPVMLADGGQADEAQMKQRGLDASNKEKPTGFFQRLREGNIDDPNSMAYKKYGAGRGRMEAELDKAEAEMKANQANARSGTIESRQAARDDADFDAVSRDFGNARAVAGAPAAVEVRPVRPRRVQVQRVDVTPAPAMTNSVSNSRGNRSAASAPAVDTSMSRGNRSAGANTLPASASVAAPVAAAARPSTGRQAQMEQDERRRAERREAGRAADAAAQAKRESDRQAFNAAMRGDAGQARIREARKEYSEMTPAERSMARGQRLKDMLGIR